MNGVEQVASTSKWRPKLGAVVRGFRLPVLTWTAAYFILWCYRSLCSVLSEVVIMRLTGIADTRGYQTTDVLAAFDSLATAAADGNVMMQRFATELTKAIGGAFNVAFFGDPILINIAFQSIGFIGLVAFLKAVEPKQRVVLYGLMFLPSISIWSSMASKEALLTCFLGIVCAHIIRIYRHTDKITLAFCVCLFLIYAYKPQYMPALILLLGVSYVARNSKQKATVALLALFCSFIALYLAHEQLDELARRTDYWLSAMGGRSGRPPFLVEPNDYYYKALEGMYLSFVGPTFDELGHGILHKVTFGESLLLVIVLAAFVVRNLPNIPVYSAILALGGIFWILFTTYPMGLSNPGTAIRYRTGYILIVFLCFAVLFSRPLYEDWIDGGRWRRPFRLRF